MTFAFDEAPTVETKDCDRCHRHFQLVKAFVVKGGSAYSVVFTALRSHDGQSEAWIDAILGTFGDDTSDDHVTFGCRVSPVEGQDEPAASLTQAASPYSNSAIWGRKISRDEALGHRRLPDFWKVMDFVLIEQPVIHQHVYGS